MRELTQEELELAPKWATHYAAFNDKGAVKVCFFNSKNAVDLFKNNLLGEVYENEVGIEPEDREIRPKPFDIAKHEWSDQYITVCEVGMDDNGLNLNIEIEVDNCGVSDYITINKDDAVAIARHFNLL